MITTTELVREIRRRNPKATMEDIGRIIGISRQAVHHHLHKVEPPVREPFVSVKHDILGKCTSLWVEM